MDRFVKEIAVGNDMRKFVFTRMENANGVKFFVTTNDEKNNPLAFSLVRAKEDRWRLTPGSLRWLYVIESELAEAILDTRLN